jgi:hypothetical protein
MDHKRETRPREILDSYCLEEGCEFKDEHAVQGHCYSREPELFDFGKLDKHERDAEEDLAQIRKEHYPDPEEYILWLESHFLCVSMNWSSTLDECVYLRAENARLKKGLK